MGCNKWCGLFYDSAKRVSLAIEEGPYQAMLLLFMGIPGGTCFSKATKRCHPPLRHISCILFPLCATPTLKPDSVISPWRPENKDVFKEMLAGVTDLRRAGDPHGAKCIWMFFARQFPAPGVCSAGVSAASVRLQLRRDTLQRKMKNECIKTETRCASVQTR